MIDPDVVEQARILADSGQYPMCPECHTPYVLRLPIMVIGGKRGWRWAKDCKHKADAVLSSE